MDKAKRRKRFQQKKRNHDKWVNRVKEKKRRIEEPTVLYDEDLKDVGIYANHGKLCSCPMCGNPRRTGWLSNDEKKTIQERRFLGK